MFCYNAQDRLFNAAMFDNGRQVESWYLDTTTAECILAHSYILKLNHHTVKMSFGVRSSYCVAFANSCDVLFLMYWDTLAISWQGMSGPGGHWQLNFGRGLLSTSHK